MTNLFRRSAAAALALAVSGTLAAQTVKVDASIPAYKRASGISGNLNSIGSDTLNNLMTFWAEGYKKAYPNVNIQIEGKGSTTAPRPSPKARRSSGRCPGRCPEPRRTSSKRSSATSPRRSRGAGRLAVYVNKDNPIEKLTLKQIDGIFSSTRKRGGKDVATWGDLGLTGDWANKPISLFGRNSASGTYGYFKEHASGQGRLSQQRQGAAGLVVRRPGCRGRQVRDRLLRASATRPRA